jgi:hypothetical protein
MRVLFAPDYRAGLPYQTLLAQALSHHGVEVSFLSDYYRGLPLFRGSRTEGSDIVHIHWPEQYFSRKGDWWDWVRVVRYPLDCWLTSRYHPIVLTAHNLLPHGRAEERGVFRNVRYTAQKSRAVFVHSAVARQRLHESLAVAKERIHLIPHGDQTVRTGRPLPREKARAKLQLPTDAKICLVFGTVSPYKGSDELVRFWTQTRLPYRLALVGPILSDAFADRLRTLAQANPTIDLRLTREWLDDSALRVWLSAADCSIFNYREIFTSGAAALARSFGLPLLIPRRLQSVDLDEPHPHVLRFDALDTDFRSQLERALATPCDYDLATDWRRNTSWDRVAEITVSVYDSIVKKASGDQQLVPGELSPIGDGGRRAVAD